MGTAAGKRGKIAKIYYATQKGVHPPRFLVFVNDPRAFAPDCVRYLEGKLREFLPFHEVPIRLELRGKKRRKWRPSRFALIPRPLSGRRVRR